MPAMDDHVPTPATTRSLTPRLVAGAAGVVILFGLHAIASLVVLAVLSILATLLLAPLQADLRRRGLPGWVALVLALGVYIGVLGVAGLILAVGLTGFVRDLPAYRDELEAMLAEIGVVLGGAGTPPPVEVDAVAAVVRGLVDDLVGMLATVGYSVFIVAYLLLEAPRAGLRVRDAFGPDSDVPERGVALASRLRSYVVARAILGAVAAVLDTILLLILGVPSALLWGVLSFLLSFIPNIGFILALIPPTVMGLLVGGVPIGARGRHRLRGDQRRHRLRRPAQVRRLVGRPGRRRGDGLPAVLGRRAGAGGRPARRADDDHRGGRLRCLRRDEAPVTPARPGSDRGGLSRAVDTAPTGPVTHR